MVIIFNLAHQMGTIPTSTEFISHVLLNKSPLMRWKGETLSTKKIFEGDWTNTLHHIQNYFFTLIFYCKLRQVARVKGFQLASHLKSCFLFLFKYKNPHLSYLRSSYACFLFLSFLSSFMVFNGGLQQLPAAFLTTERSLIGYEMLRPNANDWSLAKWMSAISNLKFQLSSCIARVRWSQQVLSFIIIPAKLLTLFYFHLPYINPQEII